MAANNKKARSTDLQELYSSIRHVIGQKCWKAAPTYGGSLSLHCGKRLAHRHPKLRGNQKGEWIFNTLGTAWRLFTPQGSASSTTSDEASVVKRLKALEGRMVTEVSVSVPDNMLTIAFGNDHLFQVVPGASDAKSRVPYWELFMPNHKLVEFGPGNSWEYRRSDVPMGQKGEKVAEVR